MKIETFNELVLWIETTAKNKRQHAEHLKECGIDKRQYAYDFHCAEKFEELAGKMPAMDCFSLEELKAWVTRYCAREMGLELEIDA